MKEIQLSQGKVAIVDDEDYDYLNQWKWYAAERKCGIWYATRNIRKDGKVRIIPMHRVILNTPKGMDTDHINGDGLDNRRSNLRSCTHMENICNPNRSLSPTKSSRFKGVYWHKGEKIWRAKLRFN